MYTFHPCAGDRTTGIKLRWDWRELDPYVGFDNDDSGS